MPIPEGYPTVDIWKDNVGSFYDAVETVSELERYYQLNTTFTVTYDGNEATAGSVLIDDKSPYRPISTVTVFGEGTLTRTNYDYKGWNTERDGTGTHYDVDDTFYITSNTTLYSEWIPITIMPEFEYWDINDDGIIDMSDILEVLVDYN